MVIVPHFDAVKWIEVNMQGGQDLTPEAIEAVTNFTLMWNLFEGLVCDNRANVGTFEAFAGRVDFTRPPLNRFEQFDKCLSFWKSRYCTPAGFNDRFQGLNLRDNDRPKLVKEVLEDKNVDEKSKLLACMIIVYRLRNNLFHGIKTLMMLNDQVSNLNTASQCIGSILKLTRSDLVRRAG
ncbi:hypothetical protein AB1L88_03980 [Tautonia sp. JC769]|uniref:hypothetical protein n=1 Tax=Tautonia sp. JC769 TaxID=3232135 RepID=UPI0034584DAA